MPPEFAAANDRTRTPNRSSSRLTPAKAPLSAKTKVPTRSSASESSSTMSGPTLPATKRAPQRPATRRRFAASGEERVRISGYGSREVR